jgi:hypothetical protein
MGDIEQPRAPGRSAAVGVLEQVFEGIPHIQGGVPGVGLIGAEGLQAIQQPIPIDRQGIDPNGEAAIQQQGEQQVLHIHGAVAPAPGLILAGQQQIPTGVAETIGIAGEAGRRTGGKIDSH